MARAKEQGSTPSHGLSCVLIVLHYQKEGLWLENSRMMMR